MQSFDSVIASLSQAHYIVVDDHVFTQLTEQQIQTVLNYINQHFSLETTIAENGRTVPVYRHINLN